MYNYKYVIIGKVNILDKILINVGISLSTGISWKRTFALNTEKISYIDKKKLNEILNDNYESLVINGHEKKVHIYLRLPAPIVTYYKGSNYSADKLYELTDFIIDKIDTSI